MTENDNPTDSHPRPARCKLVLSTMVGVFRTPRNPLRLGARIAVGQTLGNILALGLDHGIPAPFSGQLAEVHVTDGDPIEYGQTLFIIETDEPAAMGASTPEPGSESYPQTDSANHYTITAPLSGTFYAAPAPTEPSFVSVGQQIEAGQIVCIIEAMKQMNHVVSDMGGTLEQILVSNGATVTTNQALFAIALS